jgi:hypothetical protein
MKPFAMLLLVSIAPAWGYVPDLIGSPQFHRTDYAGIQFQANQNIAAGLTNASGKVWITTDSSPLDAIRAGLATWNGVATTAAHFLPLQVSSLSYNPADGNSVIVFADDANTETLAAGVLAATLIESNAADGTILDTDILYHARGGDLRLTGGDYPRVWALAWLQSHQYSFGHHVLGDPTAGWSPADVECR